MERERKYQEVFENKNKREKDGPSRDKGGRRWAEGGVSFEFQCETGTSQ